MKSVHPKAAGQSLGRLKLLGSIGMTIGRCHLCVQVCANVCREMCVQAGGGGQQHWALRWALRWATAGHGTRLQQTDQGGSGVAPHRAFDGLCGLKAAFQCPERSRPNCARSVGSERPDHLLLVKAVRTGLSEACEVKSFSSALSSSERPLASMGTMACLESRGHHPDARGCSPLLHVHAHVHVHGL